MADDRYTIPSLDRAIEVLERLAGREEGLSLAQLVRETDIPKSTLFRILTTLQRRGCVVTEEDSKKYRLGLKLWELGSAYLGQSDLDSAAVPYMKELAERCEESVFLGVMDGGEVIYVRRMESPKSVLAVRKLGQRAPAYCTATGEAMLAFTPAGEVGRLLDGHPLRTYTSRTCTDRDELRMRLEKIRKEGVAVVDGEYNAQLLCISAPVLDDTSRACASLTVAMLSAQATDESIQKTKKAVRQAAQTLSGELGYLGALGQKALGQKEATQVAVHMNMPGSDGKLAIPSD